MQLLADQRRFPMQIATSLSQAFAHSGLQFFKVNKTVTHVAVARPNYLDLETTPVSEGVKRIVEFINAHPKCSRRQLVEAIVPSPAPAPIPVAPPAVPAEGETAAAPAAPPPPAPAEPTPEQTALIADLHWLVHQGHVIEFANGQLETAKKPAPRPPKPEPKPAATEAPTAPALAPETAPTEPTVATELPTPAPVNEAVTAAPEPVPAVEATPPPPPAPDPAAPPV
jgi:hypothetical protein